MGSSYLKGSKSKSKVEEADKFTANVDDDEVARELPEMENAVDSTGELINQQPMYDKMLNSDVSMQLNDMMLTGKVARRSLGPDGKTTGSYDNNPIINSVVYDVDFPYGSSREYSANAIAENMISQADDYGFQTRIMDAIVDSKVDIAVACTKSATFASRKGGHKRIRCTTKGWKLLVKWKNGQSTWVPLKDLKESNPVETAEFAMAKGIADEATFTWWVSYTLKKRYVIICKVQARFRKTTHKYGVELPSSIESAKRLDRMNNNHIWCDALSK
uniref:Chromo domain-containing protein n=1 Tax=Eucampia antarctica TaxID=49252 RepID=A0A7S2SEL1_9STRA|mmetsp:Transcript_7105/g.6737  ORF Transcript_7105/g.6737 Transcript_7105/m.6737 type:complete len:274 (+) Transcript_7105:3-824(+)